MRSLLTPVRLAATVAGLLLAAAIALYLIPSNDYLLLPDRAHVVAPLVVVQGGKDPRGPGGIYFVDVFERRANMFESQFPWIHSGATLVPARLIVPPGVSDKAVRQADLRAMSISQRVAAAVALKRLGYKVVARPSGVIVAALDERSHAVGKLRSADVITRVNGTRTPTIRR
ncbi:MAG: Lon-like protease [Gaiellaceae bacterium]|nr:Lon-like protease [Gaiellaceae bacterium]